MRPAVEPNRIVTFYSYKGGTGRSMALANFAWILAAAGNKVLAMDWDLEAPGLHRYFRPFLVDPDLSETEGVIDAFWEFATSTMAKSQAKSKSPSWDPGKDFYERHLKSESRAKQPTSEAGDEAAEALEDTKRRLDWKFPSGGHIDFICAGQQNATYSQRVNTFDWKRFYEIGGATLIKQAKERLGKRYNWVLIDSRTGVSDTSGICTMEMPDTVVACFTLNRQSIEGVRAILTSIREFRSSTVDGSKIAFFPVATRIENAEQLRLERTRGYARNALANFLPTEYQSRPRDYWDSMEFAYRPAYAFEEVLAAFGDATGASGAADTMLTQVEATARCITGNNSLSMPEVGEKDRHDVLEKYALGQTKTTFASNKASTGESAETDILRNLRAKEQVWRSSRFSWRNLLSRREIDLLTAEDRKGLGRNMTYYVAQSEAMQKLLGFANRLSVGIWVSALLLGTLGALVLAQVVLNERYSNPHSLGEVVFNYGPLWTFKAVIIVPAIAFLFVGFGALMTVRDKPYGLRFPELFAIILGGPLHHDIRDYDPNKDTTLTKLV
jgi:cellulose biosynthesis protein BcsQ